MCFHIKTMYLLLTNHNKTQKYAPINKIMRLVFTRKILNFKKIKK
jgi:hypothetical protein